jgi:hypothetical protein
MSVKRLLISAGSIPSSLFQAALGLDYKDDIPVPSHDLKILRDMHSTFPPIANPSIRITPISSNPRIGMKSSLIRK